MAKVVFTIDGMRCDGCAKRVQTVLARQPGVRQVRVRFEASRAEAAFDPGTVGSDRLKDVIEAAGFQVVEVAG